jgi:glycerol-3-phosphate dehydrogenase
MSFLPHYDPYDVCIIGGGVNGAGIARDAAGRGLKVLLVEQGDLAQATSSASTKLIHGGLRYLEYYEFSLVRHSLQEREILLGLAPHIISPLTFVLPHADHIRPYWMIRAGLFLYDHLAPHKSLPSSRAIQFKNHPFGKPLKDEYTRGFSYADCWVDDARLVVLNAMGAEEKGAQIATRMRCTELHADESGWTVSLHDLLNNEKTKIRSKVVVNAAGPWVRQLLDDNHISDIETPSVRLVQGSHLIVPKLYEGAHAYILQQPDGRIVFAIPYEQDYTLIGTTETVYKGDPLKAQITAQEIDYLLSAASLSFKRPLTMANIIRTYSGVRPLFDDEHRDAKAVTRDYHLHESEHKGARLISVFGGKLTTYRKLSEQVTDKLTDKSGWTHREPLPGGDIDKIFAVFVDKQKRKWPLSDPALIERYARLYGMRMDIIFNDGLGKNLGDDVYEGELRYLVAHEYARTAEDILWRRTKLGMHLNNSTRGAIEKIMPSLVKELTGYDTDHYSRH